ncbi:MAG: ferritin-like domain-containing protein [Balneolaceae bacterium]
MDKLKNLENLFHHELKDIYSAETQIIEALPEMEQQATNKNLRRAFSQHLEETKLQKKRLEEIAEILEIDIKGVTCEAMQGLIKEAKSFLKEDAEDQVKDAGLIAKAQSVEHYEIAAYGTALQYAKHLKHNEVVDLLNQTLEEESAADEKLTKIAVENINLQAKEA